MKRQVLTCLLAMLMTTSVVHAASSLHATFTTRIHPKAVATISPAFVDLAPSAQQQFLTADNRGNSITYCVWSTATGGSVTQSGLYTAGTVPGLYTVLAHDTHATVTATVSIQSTSTQTGYTGTVDHGSGGVTNPTTGTQYVLNGDEILVYGPDGNLVGTIGGGNLTNASDIDILENGQIVVADGGNVKILNPDGSVSGTVAVPNATDIAVDAMGRVIVTQASAFPTSTMSIVDPNSGTVTMTVGAGLMNTPSGLATLQGLNFISDSAQSAIKVFDGSGNLQQSYSNYGSGSGQFIAPGDLTAAADRYLQVLDNGNKRAIILDVDNNYAQVNAIAYPTGMTTATNGAVDPSGNWYVFNRTTGQQFSYQWMW